jgi:hypothetical protein
MAAVEAHDVFAHVARSMILDYTSHVEKRDFIFPLPPRAVSDNVEPPVGILGAGVSGLYSALILQSLNVSYEIIEASDRTGGRLFTHKFAGGGFYDYFVSINHYYFNHNLPNISDCLQDVGAMRYPLPPRDDEGHYQPGVMQRVGWLFDYIGLQDKLVPYYYKSNKSPGFQYFNGIRVRLGEPSDFDAPALGINQSYIKAGATAIVSDVVGPFAAALYDDLEHRTTTGWEKMVSADAHSTRSYMTFAYKPNASLGIPDETLPTDVVNWLETFDKSTGWYDRGLTETVLEAIAFGQAGGAVIDWKAIEYVFILPPNGVLC